MNDLALKTAHAVRKNFENWSQACQFGWAKTKFRSELRTATKDRPMSFSYIKKNGDVRPAKGWIKKWEGKTGKKYQTNPLYIRYWDGEKDYWRSFDFRNVIINY